MRITNSLLAVILALGWIACGENNSSAASDHAIPSNIYEVNIRQYTAEGTFSAFQHHLPRLKKMGVEMIWLMPVTPISATDRKGSLGSYYAVADYKGVNPEFGTMHDFKSLVNAAHRQGIKVIIDWVANHTGADNGWLTRHPEFYVQDSTGNPVYAFDWSDTRDLNYDNAALRDSMIAAMQFWIEETAIDGFRCDVAGEVPTDFWQQAIPAIRAGASKPLFFLAEGEKPELVDAGFDATYAWKPFHIFVDIAAGKRSPLAIDSVVQEQAAEFPSKTSFLYFTSNHDENSWNGADYNTFPGEKHAPFAVLTQTLPASIPLIYSGQEEPVLRAIPFFEKDTILFKSYQRAPLYTALQKLRRTSAALQHDAGFEKLNIGNPEQVYAFKRTRNKDAVLVITNLSNSPAAAEIPAGKYADAFTNEKVNFKNASRIELSAWEYRVLIEK